MEATSPVGLLLRGWRERRLTQLDLALQADVSTRHLSYVANGRARPTSAMILHLSDQLEIPLRERNALLLAGGYAPAFPEHQLSAPPMSVVNDAINSVLDGHLPFPALVVDRHWELVAANEAIGLLTAGCADHLLEPPVNVLRLCLHPEGMAPRLTNLGQWREHLLARLAHQADTTGDPILSALHDELTGYPGGTTSAGPEPTALVVPLRYRTSAGELSLLSTTTVFGTPLCAVPGADPAAWDLTAPRSARWTHGYRRRRASPRAGAASRPRTGPPDRDDRRSDSVDTLPPRHRIR